jgi:segregation and condensation protein B
MSLKAKVEAIIYAAEEPITLEQISLLLKDVVLADLASAKENAAIEQADSDAEAAALDAVTAEASASGGPSLLPELAPESPEMNSPEPDSMAPETSSLGDVAQPEPARPEPAQDGATDTELPGDSSEAPEADGETPQASTDTREDEPAQDSETDMADATQPDSVAASVTVSSTEELAPAESAKVAAPESNVRKRQPKKSEQEIAEEKTVRTRVREILVELVTDYANEDRGMEIRQVAGGFRMATKPEHHDVVRAFAKSLKPPIRLSLAALETLAVIAYKQPITGPEIAEIRGVESASVLGTLLDRKLITTAGRKQVIGRPMQYKTSKDFLLRFGLNDVNELPSMEEFSQLASDGTIEIAPSEPQPTPSLFESGVQTATASDAVTVAPETDEPQAMSSPETAPRPLLDAQEAADSQPETEAEPGNRPETEHPVGQ